MPQYVRLVSYHTALRQSVLVIPVLLVSVCFLFLFQAEDGIRDLVRSRGLGDVYKRQVPPRVLPARPAFESPGLGRPAASRAGVPRRPVVPVSYTHLTLPTSDLV